MPDDVFNFTENDAAQAFRIESGPDLTGYESVELHIGYKPYPVVIAATIDDETEGEAHFTFNTNHVMELAEDAAEGATTLVIDPSDYDELPESGEVELDGDEPTLVERVRYSSKTAPDTLNLQDPLEYDHSEGARCEQLGDLRAGTWDAEVELVDGDGKPLTFDGLTFKIRPEIA